MDNIIQIKRLRYTKICGERRLFHDLLNNCPGKSENLKLKFRKIPWKTPAVDFCFSCAACCHWNFEVVISRNTFD